MADDLTPPRSGEGQFDEFGKAVDRKIAEAEAELAGAAAAEGKLSDLERVERDVERKSEQLARRFQAVSAGRDKAGNRKSTYRVRDTQTGRTSSAVYVSYDRAQISARLANEEGRFVGQYDKRIEAEMARQRRANKRAEQARAKAAKDLADQAEREAAQAEAAASPQITKSSAKLNSQQRQALRRLAAGEPIAELSSGNRAAATLAASLRRRGLIDEQRRLTASGEHLAGLYDFPLAGRAPARGTIAGVKQYDEPIGPQRTIFNLLDARKAAQEEAERVAAEASDAAAAARQAEGKIKAAQTRRRNLQNKGVPGFPGSQATADQLRKADEAVERAEGAAAEARARAEASRQNLIGAADVTARARQRVRDARTPREIEFERTGDLSLLRAPRDAPGVRQYDRPIGPERRGVRQYGSPIGPERGQIADLTAAATGSLEEFEQAAHGARERAEELLQWRDQIKREMATPVTDESVQAEQAAAERARRATPQAETETVVEKKQEEVKATETAEKQKTAVTESESKKRTRIAAQEAEAKRKAAEKEARDADRLERQQMAGVEAMARAEDRDRDRAKRAYSRDEEAAYRQNARIDDRRRAADQKTADARARAQRQTLENERRSAGVLVRRSPANVDRPADFTGPAFGNYPSPGEYAAAGYGGGLVPPRLPPAPPGPPDDDDPLNRRERARRRAAGARETAVPADNEEIIQRARERARQREVVEADHYSQAATRGQDAMALAEDHASAAMNRQTAVLGASSQQYRKHGALTTEFIEAAVRGEASYREWGYQIGATALKFAGWTAVSVPVFAAAGAVQQVGQGAIQSASGVEQLRRSINNVSADKAKAEFRSLSREFNVPIETVVQAAQGMGTVYHDQAEAFKATRAALFANVTGDVPIEQATKNLTAIANATGGNASTLIGMFDQLNSAQNNYGATIPDLLAGLAKSSGAFTNAGGSVSELIALLTTAQRVTGRSGQQLGTVFARTADYMRRPENREVLRSFGIDASQGADQVIQQAFETAQGLSGDRLLQLAKGLTTPEFAPVLTSILQRPDLFERIRRDTSPEASRGASKRERDTILRQLSQEIARVGVNLQDLGSNLEQSGALTLFGAMLKTVNLTLEATNKLLDLFNELPKPIREAVTVGLQLAGILRIARRFNIGQAFSDRGRLPGVASFLTESADRRARRLGGRGLREALGYQRDELSRQALSAARAGTNARLQLNRFDVERGTNIPGETADQRNIRVGRAWENYEAADLRAKALADDTELLRKQVAEAEKDMQGWRAAVRSGTARQYLQDRNIFVAPVLDRPSAEQVVRAGNMPFGSQDRTPGPLRVGDTQRASGIVLPAGVARAQAGLAEELGEAAVAEEQFAQRERQWVHPGWQRLSDRRGKLAQALRVQYAQWRELAGSTGPLSRTAAMRAIVTPDLERGLGDLRGAPGALRGLGGPARRLASDIALNAHLRNLGIAGATIDQRELARDTLAQRVAGGQTLRGRLPNLRMPLVLSDMAENARLRFADQFAPTSQERWYARRQLQDRQRAGYNLSGAALRTQFRVGDATDTAMRRMVDMRKQLAAKIQSDVALFQQLRSSSTGMGRAGAASFIAGQAAMQGLTRAGQAIRGLGPTLVRMASAITAFIGPWEVLLAASVAIPAAYSALKTQQQKVEGEQKKALSDPRSSGDQRARIEAAQALAGHQQTWLDRLNDFKESLKPTNWLRDPDTAAQTRAAGRTALEAARLDKQTHSTMFGRAESFIGDPSKIQGLYDTDIRKIAIDNQTLLDAGRISPEEYVRRMNYLKATVATSAQSGAGKARQATNIRRSILNAQAGPGFWRNLLGAGLAGVDDTAIADQITGLQAVMGEGRSSIGARSRLGGISLVEAAKYRGAVSLAGRTAHATHIQEAEGVAQDAQAQLQRRLALARGQDERDTAYGRFQGDIDAPLRGGRQALAALQQRRERLQRRVDTTGLGDPRTGDARATAQQKAQWLQQIKDIEGDEKKLRAEMRDYRANTAEARRQIHDQLWQEHQDLGDAESATAAARLPAGAARVREQLRRVGQRIAADIRHFGRHSKEVEQDLQDQLGLQDQLSQSALDAIDADTALAVAQATTPGGERAANIAGMQQHLAKMKADPRTDPTAITQYRAQILAQQKQDRDAERQDAEAAINARYDLLEATMDPGDTVAIARKEADRAARLYALGNFKTPADRVAALANKRAKDAELVRTRQQDRFDTIEFMASVGQMSKSAEVEGLRRLEKTVRNNKELRRSIQQRIYQLTHEDDSGSNDLTIGNVRVPSLYEVRRAIAGGSKNLTNVNQNRVEVHVHGPQDYDALGRVLETHVSGTGRSLARAGGQR